MKYLNIIFFVAVASTILQGCGGGGEVLGDDNSVDMLQPEPPAIDYTTIDRPSESAPVMTTDERFIYDANGNKLDLRGVDLNYYVAPDQNLAALDAIASTGANIVRLLVDGTVTAAQLQAALDKVVENGLVAIVAFTEDLVATNCMGYTLDIDAVLLDLWFGEWHNVLIQDKYQAHLMINFAKGFGPLGIHNPNSLGYDLYIDVYEAVIGVFRNAGIKVPIVVDAPDCGADFNAFAAGRGRRLLAADIEKNVILSAGANNEQWNSSSRILNALTLVSVEKMPFFMSGIAGSEVGSSDKDYVDHLDVMSKAVGNQGIRIDMPWGSEDDGAAYAMALPETSDLNGGAASIDVFLDRPLLEYDRIEGSINYAPKGTLKIATFVRDVNGNELLVGSAESRDIRAFLWNTVRGNIPSAEDLDPTNLIKGETFDPANISHIGVQVLANGKAADVKGDIQLDNLLVFPGVAPLVNNTFSESLDGWEVAWGEGAVLTSNAGVLEVQPIGTEISIGSSIAAQSIDFTKDLLVSFDIYIPEGYPRDGLWANLYGQFGADWSVWAEVGFPIATVIQGEWTTLTISMNLTDVPEGIEPPDVSIPQRLGILTGGGYTGSEVEPILIDNFIVEDVNARPTKTITSTQYQENFADGPGAWADTPGWHGDGEATVGTVIEEEVLGVLVPGTADEKRGGAINNSAISSVQEIDFGGAIVVKYDIFLPESLVGTEAVFKLFLQDGTWANQLDIAEVRPDDIALGEWVSLEYRVEEADYPEGFNRKLQPNRFGVDYINVPGGTEFYLDNFEIIGDLVVDDLQPIYAADFSTAEEVANFLAESGGGSLNLDAAAAAKSAGWAVIPFGWTASTWYGAENDEIGLDISNSLDALDLTERGEEIVNGENGIRNTASD